MGTSSPFGGGSNKNPLIPSWLGAGSSGDDGDNDGGDNGDSNDNGADDSPGGQNASPIKDNTTPSNRYTKAKGNFTSFVRSGGSDRRKLGKALSSYVHTTAGGSRNATRRMLSDTLAGATFAQFLNTANTVGLREAARRLDLKDLENKDSIEIYAAMVDVVCMPGGDLDDSFARSAYSEAIIEVMELGLPDLEQPSLESIAIIMERFITNSIYNRIINAIGAKAITLPENIDKANNIIDQLKDFIRAAVSDAMTRSNNNFQTDDMRTNINNLYEQSFTILQSLSESEVSE